MDALTPTIGYTRTNGHSNSTDKQQSLITELAERTGHTITAWTDSPEEAVDIVKAGRARTVLTVDVARFGRKAGEALGWLQQIHDAGGRVETLDGPVDMDGAALQLVAGLDEVNEQVRRKTEAIYIRRSVAAERPVNQQKQAAEVWATAERLGYELVEIDGTRLDDEPPRC